MAEETRRNTATLQSTSHIPIAQLTPLLLAPSTRSIKAVVTLIWPYSSATKAVAFLLAEPDFRLRRTRGQVRVQFSGSSAKKINESGIESGDEVTLCLDGVEFVNGDTVSTPGRGVEFDLRFTERLLLESRQQETHHTSILDVNHPEIEVELPNNEVIRNLTPESEPLQPSVTSTPVRPEIQLADDEFSSPAFIKRARTSYGSLWEDDFEAGDGSVKGKGRKRTRMSDTWTVTTRDLTPESEEVEEPETEISLVSPINSTNQISTMDEGIQTEDMETGAEALLEFAKQTTFSIQSDFGMPRPLIANANGIAGFQVPPIISTTSAPIQEDVSQMRPPSSPRLQPLSSENLPLVSPLISRRSFTPVSNIPYLEEEMPNHSYINAVGRGGDDTAAQFEGLRNHSFEFHDSNMSGLEQGVFPENQYGNWQSRTAQLSQEQLERVTEEQEETDRFNVEEHDDGDAYENLQSPILPPNEQYPELDEVPSERGNPSTWAPVPDSISYPELSDHGDNLDELVQSLSGPQSRGMSRSVSAQSAVIDLTESDEEEEEEADEEDEEVDEVAVEADEEDVIEEALQHGQNYHENPATEEGYEDESEEDEEEYDDENDLPNGLQHSPKEVQALAEDEQIEESEDDDQAVGNVEEEYYSEDDLDSQGNPYPAAYYEGEEEEFEEEEGEESYDEDEMEEEPPARPIVQRAPIVIDLLSSDDEDDSQPIPASTVAAVPKPQREISGHPDSESSSESESGEEVDEVSTQVPVFNELVGSEEDDSQASTEGEKSADFPVEPPAPGESFALQSGESPEKNDEEDVSNEMALDASDENEDLTAKTQDADLALGTTQEMEVDESESQEPGSLASMQDVEQRSRPPSRAFGLDGADDDDKMDRGGNDGQRSLFAAIPSLVANTSKPPPQRPSLFSRIFSIDGANDEPEDEVSYPTLPKEELSPPSTATNSQSFSQSFGVRFPIGSAQLPTPEDSQLVQNSLSQQASFTSIATTSQSDVETSIQTSEEVMGNALPESIASPKDDSIETDSDAAKDVTGDAVQAQTEPSEVNDIIMEINPNIMHSEQQTQDTEVDNNSTEENVTSKDIMSDENQEQSQVAEPSVISDVDLEDSQDITSRAIQEQLASETLDDVMEDPIVSGLTEEVELKSVSEKTTIVRKTVKLTIDDGTVEENADGNDEESKTDMTTELPSKSVLSKETISEEPVFTIESPRRSHRRVKSTPKAGANKENIRAVPATPPRPTKAATPSSARSDLESPMVVIDKRSTPKGHDASIETALSSLDTPEKHHDLRRPPMTDLKLRLNRNLRTELEDFKSLKILRYELNNKKFNVLAIATTATPEPERVKNGPRHYLITFNITDPSVAPAGVTEVQIFRPYKEALPIIKPGDGVLLRDFQVVSLKNRGFGLKSDPGSSSWAVFKGGVEVEVRGPPVEYGDGEMNHMAQMKEWYASLDSASVAKLRRANGDKSAGAGV